MLEQEGFEPIIVDDMSTGHMWAVRGTLIKGDIGDSALINHLIQEYKPLAIMHFASKILVGESMQKPQDYYLDNVSKGLVLFKAAADNGIPVIFSSSAAVYGTPETVPIPEDARLEPESVYGETKLVLERALNWFSQRIDARYISLRYFNAAGAWPDKGLGEAHPVETHLIPLTLMAGAGQTEALRVFGDDYPTEDGTCIRDYVHVIDLAKAHLLALRYLLDNGKSQVFNLGSQTGYSVMQVIKTAERVIGKPIPTRITQRRPGDPAVLIASSGKIREVLGWQAQRELTDMIADAWEFYNGTGHRNPGHKRIFRPGETGG